MPDLRQDIAAALAAFESLPPAQAAKHLFETLGYKSDRTLPLSSPEEFLTFFDSESRLNELERNSLAGLSSLQFLFQLTDSELSNQGELLDDPTAVQSTRIESYLFFACELPDGNYTRTRLSTIARAINKPLLMPALVLIRYGQRLSLAMLHRRLNKRDQSRDVLEKTTLIKDILFTDPIRAHVEILNDFSLANLSSDFPFDVRQPFISLHTAWQKRLGSFALSNDFYREIADWYFWANHLIQEGRIRLPLHCDTEQEKSLFLIRLLTRLIFCWFLVEKRLLPGSLFRTHELNKLLKELSLESGNFYRAILQNLFFGTLNMPEGQRAFRQKKKPGERYDANYGITNLWRHEDEFRDSADWIALAAHIPFLNGGLFDCLDDKSGKKQDNFILDGFSDREDFSCHLPNDLFFGPERTVDLSRDYGEEEKKTARSKRAKVRGLIEILSRYKFTIEENTPLEEEIALDPELLGKVFENLLASYNEDTRTTARKALGAFYTPREIVTYMVDEALKSYLSTQVPRCKGALDDLFSNKATLRDIRPDTRDALISAIGCVKILDPACGSGAFPMGTLHRLVDLLQKLDPENARWREIQRQRALAETEQAFQSGDKESREQRLKEINDTFEFNSSNYGRKLYLIENAIYGVDIQPVAVQIAKLRFFISLVVDQRVSLEEKNLGVRPLPNLETRLVAADTLIPIPRPQLEQASLFSEDVATRQQVEQLKKDLQAVRHAHFNARDPRRKRICKEQDQDIRAKLGAVLANTGMDAPTASKLAAWDPYDQNEFAPFFDAEWMFGLPIGKVPVDSPCTPATLRGNLALINETSGQMELTESSTKVVDSGFDVVIGNPPYGARFPAHLKRQLCEYYHCASKAPDSYAFFILRGLALLRSGGALAYIVPNTFCDLENANEFRTHILRNASIQCIWESGWVFSAAVVDTLVMILEASKPRLSHSITVITDEKKCRKSQACFLEAPLAKIDFRSSDRVASLKNRIRQSTKALSEFFYVKAGVKMYEKGKGDPPQSKEIVNTKPFSRSGLSSKYWRVLYRGANIAPFHLTDSCERVKYGPWLAAPRSPELFKGPKILMRRTDDRLLSCLDLSDAICVNSCHVIKLRSPCKNSFEPYLATLAILNSRVCQWVFEADNPQMVGKTFAEIKVVYVERLPLPPISRVQLQLISPPVEILLFLNCALKSPNQTNRDALMLAYWERILNGLVYELYFPEELHSAGLRLFDLVEAAGLPDIIALSEAERLPRLRQKFEELHDGAHPLRIPLDKLQTLETVRIIEGKAQTA
jgi:adenine-specific DNA-methyltransferase